MNWNTYFDRLTTKLPDNIFSDNSEEVVQQGSDVSREFQPKIGRNSMFNIPQASFKRAHSLHKMAGGYIFIVGSVATQPFFKQMPLTNSTIKNVQENLKFLDECSLSLHSSHG